MTETAHQYWNTRWSTAAGQEGWTDADPWVMAFAKERFAAGDRRGLDLGCGVGRHALALAAAGWDMSALDAASDGLAALSGANPAIATHQGSFTDLPYEDGAFDYVLSFNVIYHGDRTVVERAAAEIARVTRPGGWFQGTLLSLRNRHVGNGREVMPGTWVQDDATDDKVHPHTYLSATEAVSLLPGFEVFELQDRETGKPGSWHWHLTAERR